MLPENEGVETGPGAGYGVEVRRIFGGGRREAVMVLKYLNPY